MADGRLKAYLGQGDTADRPAAPDIPATTLAFWYDPDTKVLSLYNVSTVTWEDLGVGGIAGGMENQVLAKLSDLDFNYGWVDPTGGIPDAPEDTELYGRKDGAWEVIDLGDPGIPDAPVNGTAYVRKNAGWVPESGGGGGGSGHPWYWNPPVAADFTDSNQLAALTVADDADVGLIMSAVGPFDFTAALGKPVSQVADWQLTIHIDFASVIDHYPNFGIALWNAAKTKFFMWSLDGRNAGQTLHLYRNSATGFDGYEQFSQMGGAQAKWLRVKYINATGILQAFWSNEGKVWIDFGLTATPYTDMGNQHPISAGLGMVLGSYSRKAAMTCDFFELI